MGGLTFAASAGLLAAIGVLATMGPTWPGFAIVGIVSFTASLLVLWYQTPAGKRRVEALWGALADRTR